MPELNFDSIDRFFRGLGQQVEKLTGKDEPRISGEALLPRDETYVYRKADEELDQFLRSSAERSRVCYILAAPQTGKSSLMLKAGSRLEKSEYISIRIRVQTSVANGSALSLYLDMIKHICQGLKLDDSSLMQEMEVFWREAKDLQPSEKFRESIAKIIPQIGNRKLIVFIEEIQQLIEWRLQDDFMSLMREISESDEEPLQKLKFVLLGVANPLDLIREVGYKGRIIPIELGPLSGDCQPLLGGLTKVSKQPAAVLQEILRWTGGQPFLTKILCDLAAKRVRIREESEIKAQISRLVRLQILQEERSGLLQSHFQKIEHYFIRGASERTNRILYGLKLYRRILRDSGPCEFREHSAAQRDLLVSGLVKKSDDSLDCANLIYKQIFTDEWIEASKKIIRQRRYDMGGKLFDRKVYILVDRSGSMTDPDTLYNQKTRWEQMSEMLKGHVSRILKYKGMKGEEICDEITLTFFSQNKVTPFSKIIQDSSQIEPIFTREVAPLTSTYIGKTLRAIVEQWIANPEKKGGFIIVYTDGDIDDQKEFLNVVESTCGKLNSQDDLKIIIIGIGSYIASNPKFWLRTDANANDFKDRHGKDCNIVVFDKEDEVEDIIELLERQLENPLAGLPEWGKEFCPELYQ